MSMTNKYHKVLQISRIEVNVPFLPMVFLNNHHWGLGQLSSPRIGKVFMSHLSNKLGDNTSGCKLSGRLVVGEW